MPLARKRGRLVINGGAVNIAEIWRYPVTTMAGAWRGPETAAVAVDIAGHGAKLVRAPPRPPPRSSPSSSGSLDGLACTFSD
jgi:hypothetical protein